MFVEERRFLGETGVYTNESEFVKEAVQSRLQHLNDEAGIAALRLGQMLATEQSSGSDDELRDQFEDLRASVDADPEEIAVAVEAVREETAERTFDQE